MSKTHKKKDLRSILKLLAPIFMAIPALGILFWTFFFTSNLLENWAEASLVKTGNQITEKTTQFLQTAAVSADYNATWIETNMATATFVADFYKITHKQMSHFPYFKLIYFGDNKGNHWLNKMDPDGSVRSRVIERLDDSLASREAFAKADSLSETQTKERNLRQQLLAPLLRTTWYKPDENNILHFSFRDPVKVYDPRLRPWYKAAQKNQAASWIDVYTWQNKFKGQIKWEAGITISSPVMHKNTFVGVIGIDLVLDAISEFLAQLYVSPHGQAFIFDSLGQVVGLPNQGTLLLVSADADEKIHRIQLRDVQNPAIADAYAALRKHLSQHDNIQTEKPLGQFQEEVLRFSSNDENFLSFFQPLDPSYNLDWYVGVIMPEADIKGSLTQQFRWILIGIIVVVLLFLSFIPFYLKSEKDRLWIRNAFSKYVSPNRVDYLLKNPDHLSLGGEYRECSFVMTDLKGFTSLMEQYGNRADPQVIVDTLNEYLEGMVSVAFRHEGTLDRIVGDAVAVLFSAPVPQADHAQRAVACALEMDQFATQFSLDRQNEGLPFGYTRIGVNSGKVLLGNFGGKAVFDYRALGDPINTAARLESINNQLGTRICVSEATVSRLPAGFRGRLVGTLILKGKSQGIKTYQPLTEEEFDTELIDSYMAAYRLMANKDPNALAAFSNAIKQWPDDPLLQFHHRRLRRGELGDTILFTDK